MDATIFLDTHKDLSTWDILFSPSKKKSVKVKGLTPFSALKKYKVLNTHRNKMYHGFNAKATHGPLEYVVICTTKLLAF
jgi:hypothetical protein